MNRRKFLKHSIRVGAVAAATQNVSGLFAKSSIKDIPLSSNALRIPPLFTGGDLIVAQTTFQINSGINSNVFSVNNTFPAPTIRLKKGDTFSALIKNNLTEPTVIHWHGIHAPAAMDGHPRNAIAAGSTFNVTYPIIQRAGTYFYHSHTDMNTARQSYMGMTGMFIIEDDEEKALGLPSGEFEIPLLIQDKRFDANGALKDYAPTNADMIAGWLGETILINGTPPNAFLNVAQTMYRFRIVNGSNARIYNIALSDGKQFTIIGNDGGLLESPAAVTSAMLAPAERLDIIVDFSGYSVGQNIILKSLPFVTSDGPGSGSLRQGAEINLLQFNIDRAGAKGNPIPAALSVITKFNSADAKGSRGFSLSGHQFINSQIFEMNRIDNHVLFGELEQWVITNLSESIHPIHVHGVQFQIITPTQPSEYGWKDVVRVEAFQTVQLLLRFADYTGIYLIHCHNLEHEDMGMMSNFQVELAGEVKQEHAGQNEMEIFPNPAADYTFVKFPTLQSEEALMLIDISGKVILKNILGAGITDHKLLTDKLPIGSYRIVFGKYQGNLIVMR